MKIFLSHRSNNKPLVREFKVHLPHFLHIWLDEDSLSWGDPLSISLKESIKSNVDFLIIFLDGKTLESEWVKKELKWALEREKELQRTFVLPILINDANLDNLPSEFEDRLYLTLPDYNKESVKVLADKVTLQLFDLVIKSLSELKYETSPTLKMYDATPSVIKSIIVSLSDIGKVAKDNRLYDIALNQILSNQILSAWWRKAEEYSRGTIKLSDPWTTDLMVKEMYKHAQSTVFSTCAIQYLHQWETKHGDALLEAHKNNQANVTRVFIFNDRSEVDERAQKIMLRHESQGIEVRIFVSNERTAYSFPSEIQKDFTVIDQGAAIGVTTAFITFENKEKTQATWYFSNKQRYPQFKMTIERLTDVDVPTFTEFFGSRGN